ncbi:MAG: KEOPS complex subunit Cgi121 [Thermoplasmatota archaeon]
MTRSVQVHPFETDTELSGKDIQRIIVGSEVTGLPVLMDLDAIFSRSHLSSGIMHAARSLLNKEARAREPSIEVLRWLSGSHQVSRGIRSAGPGPGTKRLLLAVLPPDWPIKEDVSALPDITEVRWTGADMDHLRPLAVPAKYGKDDALRKLGLDPGAFNDNEEKERAVLEMVCLPGLR